MEHKMGKQRKSCNVIMCQAHIEPNCCAVRFFPLSPFAEMREAAGGARATLTHTDPVDFPAWN
jgi:hypothetical protein